MKHTIDHMYMQSSSGTLKFIVHLAPKIETMKNFIPPSPKEITEEVQTEHTKTPYTSMLHDTVILNFQSVATRRRGRDP
jgi:hypothetical protein